MKKIYVHCISLTFFFFVVLCVSSCKKEGFLTKTTTTNLTSTTVFTDSLNAEGFLANIYSNIGFATSASRFFYKTPSGTSITCGGLDAACDESEVSHTYSTTALAFATGAINAGLVTDDAYSTCYTQIRAINQLYKNIGLVPIKAANKAQMLAEAQFLKAWYYFILLEHYGGVPIVGYNIYDYTQPIPATRSTFAQCVSYITAECDSAYKVLPLVQTGMNYGRASGGACLALKARVLLYAASPLYNKPGSMASIQTPADLASAAVKPLVAYPSYDATRWATAEAAAQAVIQTGAYQLFTDSTLLPGYGEEGAFQYLFTVRGSNGNGAVNNEYIWNYMEPEGNSILEGLFQPPTRDGDNGGAYPYQGMVDAFPMANGKQITDPNSGYDPTNPYAKRDPRLYYSIVYDQHLMGTRTNTGLIDGFSPVNIYLSSASGSLSGGPDAVYQGTLTGYYNNKMLDPNAVAQTIFQGTNRVIPLIRFAEILLDYAEAANENEGPTANVYAAVEQVRQRAGLSPYQLPTGLSQADMRTAIQNERRVELAYEGNRFFDVRRWLIANQTDNVQGSGMEVDRNAQFVPTYKIFPVRKHNFHTAMYLWPFPQAEIGKGSGLVQNPGY
ncbi:RagB/SusD family nutrient uptake outer membrane protein [Mucilaginibacter sp. E4BP6]|uniref:RagB/SusD family nutrient uptake outer membrane protein n=1 Tax=Mucilaginibacter sp. E4BP6 TaxID=2723089 RepID=UPI0015C7E886|nr:RagB/SusD family nutrient uptake outer membrane protein [Mucilaginibacter sp. E4BP6]NYE66880.1 hypothetical protein [Mucilaginibacter sp. E4BP6]